jgi:hypothetical protein
MDGRRDLKRSEALELATVLDELIWQAKVSPSKTQCAAAIVHGSAAMVFAINGPAESYMPHCYCKRDGISHEQCRVHAEWQAILTMLMPDEDRANDPWQGPMGLENSRLVVVRLNPDATLRMEEPYFCAVCARIAMSVGVTEWVYQMPEGLVAYDAVAYDQLSRVLG